MEKLFYSPIATKISNRYRYRINWFAVYMVTILNGISPFIQIPSLHQYVTSSANQTDSNIEPGLGLSETWYSVIVSAGSLGTFIGAFTYGFLARYIYVKAGVIVELLVNLTGGMLYSFSFNGYMILTARLFIGLFNGIHMSMMRVYVFETSARLIQELPPERRGKTTIKYTAMFFLLLHGVLGRALAPVIVAIAAQFPSISEFRLPGYYISAHAFLLIIFIGILFNERRNDISRSTNDKDGGKTLFQRLLTDITSPAVPHYLSLVFVFVFFILGCNVSIVETLQNPILSDQFGLNVKATSYVFIGVLSIYLVSIIVMYSFQKLKVDNRIILVLCLVVGVVGSIILIDWQSLGGDPCRGSWNITAQERVEGNVSDASYYCELFGVESGYECFWNPDSRITGDYCERCRQVCLSSKHSLNFVQLLFGLGMTSFSVIPGRVLASTMISDIAGTRSVGSLMGLLVAVGALSQALSPLWTNWSYQASNQHTWLPLSVLAFGQFISVVCILTLCRRMKRRVHYNLNDSNNYEGTELQRDEIQLVQIVPTEDEWVESDNEWVEPDNEWVESDNEWVESNEEDTAKLLTADN